MDLLLATHRYTYKDSEIGSAFHNPKHLVAQNTLTLAQYCLRFRRFVQQVSFTFLFIMLFFLYNNSTLSNCFTNCLGLRPLRVKFSCLSLAISSLYVYFVIFSMEKRVICCVDFLSVHWYTQKSLLIQMFRIIV